MRRKERKQWKEERTTTVEIKKQLKICNFRKIENMKQKQIQILP